MIEPPENAPWMVAYWEAWHALRHDRSFVGNLAIEQPITFVAIDRYADRFGYDKEAFSHLLLFVSVIDEEYRSARAIERERMMPKPPPQQDTSK